MGSDYADRIKVISLLAIKRETISDDLSLPTVITSAFKNQKEKAGETVWEAAMERNRRDDTQGKPQLVKWATWETCGQKQLVL